MWLLALMVAALCCLTARAHISDRCSENYYAASSTNAGNQDQIEVPSLDEAIVAYKKAPREIRDLVKEDDVDNAFKFNKERPGDFIAPYVSDCCPEKEMYRCQTSWIPLRFVRYWYRTCFVLHSLPSAFYARCSCRTCLKKGSQCPTIGRCVETNIRYYYVVAYCPRHWPRFVKIVIRLPTSCQCLTGCPYFNFKVAPPVTDKPPTTNFSTTRPPRSKRPKDKKRQPATGPSTKATGPQ